MSQAAPLLSPQQTYDNNSGIRTAVNRLTELLEWLYPEPSPDIFTVRDYRNRYPFTRLGPLATNDIDRYQRINRAIGNHVQLGLCEYHIGLIYLHEGDFRGAVQQFEQARQQWTFVNQTAAIALTHLARTVALRQADHYESALVSAGKVAGWLDRARFAETVPQEGRFFEKVLSYVAEQQAELRQMMSPPPETAVLKPDDGAASRPVGPVAAEPDPEPVTKTEGDNGSAADTSPPIINLGQSAIPVPGHRLINERYEWYVVEWRPVPGLLPEINSGDWVLVDLQPVFTRNVQDTEQPILVVMDKKIEGTIRVRPLESRGRRRIYLATLDDSPTGSFWRDEETGTVTFSPEMARVGINRNEILGVVVGFWRPMFEQSVA